MDQIAAPPDCQRTGPRGRAGAELLRPSLAAQGLFSHVWSLSPSCFHGGQANVSLLGKRFCRDHPDCIGESARMTYLVPRFTDPATMASRKLQLAQSSARSNQPPAERVALGSPPQGGIGFRKAPLGPMSAST